MLDALIQFSLRQRGFIILVLIIWVGLGVWSGIKLPIDAVPDITNVQVQINTSAGAYAAEEVEKLVTFPLESEMSGLPRTELIRSISRYGFSQLTIIFEEGAELYHARQFVAERLQNVRDKLPPGVEPQMAPITTGLGDIYFYTLSYSTDALNKPESKFRQLMELKQVQEYLVKPFLRSVSGVAEINTSGGYTKEIMLRPDPVLLRAAGLTFHEFAQIIAKNTENVGGGLLEIGGEQVSIRSNGRVETLDGIRNLPVCYGSGVEPILVSDLAVVEISSRLRTGASTENGEEALLGGVLMLAGENSREVSQNVHERIEELQFKLPEGVEIRTVYDRSDVVRATIRTVRSNLLEGAALVIAILFLMLGNIRAAILVALAIPLSMLFALIGMKWGGVSGNLMSLGAIDFGLIVEGAVVMVENAMRRLGKKQAALGRSLDKEEHDCEILLACKEMARPMFFGVLIITIVYVPILALTGIEGKMFKPMASTVILALIGSLILALTVIPVLSSWILTAHKEIRETRFMGWLKKVYQPVLDWALAHRMTVIMGAVTLVATSVLVFTRLGAEFIPQLDEGSMSIQMIRSNSTGIQASLEMQKRSEKVLMEKFSEVTHTFSRIGTAEVATDPMGTNVADTYVFLKPENEWRNGWSKDDLIMEMREVLEREVPGQSYLFTQPIELRFNELLAGTRSDLSLKIFGDDFSVLEPLAEEVMELLEQVPGAGDVEFEVSGRNPLLEIRPRWGELKRLNVHAEEINRLVESALAGDEAGMLIEGNRRFPILVRAPELVRHNIELIDELVIRTDNGGLIPLRRVADIEVVDAIGTIGRESIQRRLAVLVNIRDRDTESYVKEAIALIEKNVEFPDGYYFDVGGQYENLVKARERLIVIIPSALVVIFILIFMAFGSLRQVAVIFTGIPLAMVGGVWALWLRDMPFSISAGIGFIALSGIATLDGIVLVTVFNQLREEGRSLVDAVKQGAMSRLRPVMMTSLVASLGFVPMALATSAGAEVQRPLATVVIGGVLFEVFLTLLLVPVLYLWIEERAVHQHQRKNVS
ncbi:MAG: CusA/CzcA family heavy metal efflux RND transporter [Verrucomicrobiota bacterium]